MKKCDLKLKELIETVVLPDIEDNLDDIFAEIARDKNTSLAQKEEIDQMHEMRDDFNSILKDIKNRELNKEECEELFNEISSMIEEAEQD
jgi:hypothetical protein